MTKQQNEQSPILQNFISRLGKWKYIGSDRYSAKCPAHDGEHDNSLSITTGKDGRILCKCFAGCSTEEVVKAIGLEMKDLFVPSSSNRSKHTRGAFTPPKRTAPAQPSAQPNENKGTSRVHTSENPKTTTCNHATAQNHSSSGGLTLEQYAEAKRLPVEFLKEIGLETRTYMGKPAVKIPYRDNDGHESSRYRIALQKGSKRDDRFRWTSGSRLMLYGLDMIFPPDRIVLVEGESDTQTLWFHDFAAYGIPGASNWREDRDAFPLSKFDTVYVTIEPDKGGETVIKWLSGSTIRDRARLVWLNGFKDVSELHIKDPDRFKNEFEKALEASTPWSDYEKAKAEKELEESWPLCKELATCKDILSVFVDAVRRAGVVGEERSAQIVFLALMTRHQKRPVSIVVKGPSSAGKNFTVETTLLFFPQSVYYALSSMSEHALAYSTEPLQNRFLVLYESAGLNSDLASYLLRSLLSEGHIRYETVEKTSEGMVPKLIVREGPTGAILTTTSISLHPENETRLLSIPILDTREQTRLILGRIADPTMVDDTEIEQWRALQTFLDVSCHDVTIPYASRLAELIPPLAVRLRRDFTTVLNLIKGNAILHQVSRERDPAGRIVATVEDYEVVKELVGDLLAYEVDAGVTRTIRETVRAAEKLLTGPGAVVQVSAKAIATALGLDKSSGSRRTQAAIKKGYLVNIEKVKGKPLIIQLGEPLPDDVELLPSSEKLSGCTVAGEMGGVKAQGEYIDLPDEDIEVET